MTTVADLMTTDVVRVYEDQDVVFATGAMKLRRIRHLPVVRDDVLVGLISHRDLLRAQARFLTHVQSGGTETSFSSVLAKEVMSEDVLSVPPEMPADEAAMILVDRKIGCLPVVSGDVLVGIITEADFLRWAVGVLGSSNASG